MPRIVAATTLTQNTTAIEIEAPELASTARPAQIVLIRFARDSGWIPKPLARVDRDRGTVTILCSNAAYPSERATEPEVKGPFGAPKAWDQESKVVFVFEGLGLGAVLEPLRASKASGSYTIVVAGYRSQSEVFWLDRLDEASDELYTVTEDGSYGIKGPIRHVLRALCEQTGDIDRIHVAGSMKLLKTASDVARTFGIPATANLAAIFDDGLSLFPAGEKEVGVAEDAFDWGKAAHLDAHTTDLDDIGRRFGIPVTR